MLENTAKLTTQQLENRVAHTLKIMLAVFLVEIAALAGVGIVMQSKLPLLFLPILVLSQIPMTVALFSYRNELEKRETANQAIQTESKAA